MKRNQDKELDNRLSALLRKDLHEAPENPWFVRRVMNMLPDKKCGGAHRFWQLACYIFGALCFIAVEVWLGIDVVTSGFSMQALVTLCGISIITLFCVAIVAVPAFIHAFRDA